MNLRVKKFNDSIRNYEEKSICLTSIAENKVNTEGKFTATDQYYTDMKFHVAKDHVIPVALLIGNPIIKDFEVWFIPEGVRIENINHLTLLLEEKDNEREYVIEDSKYAKKIRKICEEYKPNEKKKESNVKLKILLTDEDIVFQNARRLSP